MPYDIKIEQAGEWFPALEFVRRLPLSAQKAAFHVRQFGRDCCLKIIAPDYTSDRLGREVMAMQKLDHPNVVKLIECAFVTRGSDTINYIIEEFVDGCDLTDVISDRARAEKLHDQIFLGLCSGLSALKARDIVHRDLKPGNVRVRPDGRPVIIDFGLARHLGMESLTGTFVGARIGTPRYFAPEQFIGVRSDIDHRTDLFALGTMMFESKTGSHPFHKIGMTLDDLAEAVCRSELYADTPEFLALDRKTQLIIRRLLSKERSGRPINADIVSKLLIQ